MAFTNIQQEEEMEGNRRREVRWVNGTQKHLRNGTNCDCLSCLIFVIFCVISRKMAIVTRLFDQKRPPESIAIRLLLLWLWYHHNANQSLYLQGGKGTAAMENTHLSAIKKHDSSWIGSTFVVESLIKTIWIFNSNVIWILSESPENLISFGSTTR